MIPEIQTIILAMVPINELRGTIPLAISVFHLEPSKAFFFSVIGNILPIFFLLWFLPKFSGFLIQKYKFFNIFFSWLFSRTRDRFYKKYQKFGDFALILFVALPLPFTGAWTGAVASFLFGIPYWKGLILISFGVIIAGIIVTLLSTGFFSLIGLL